MWALLIAIVYVIVQTAVYLAYARVLHGEISEKLLAELEFNGTVFSLAVISTLFVCGLMTCGVILLKKGSSVTQYLALNRPTLNQIIFWGAISILLIIVSDSLSMLLGKPIIPEYSILIYQSTNHQILLFFAIVIAAPLFEELFFRGFLFSGFIRTFLGPIGTIFITSILWAVIHIQYEFYLIATIFVAGIILGVARIKTNSIIVVISLHSLMNLVAYIEVVLLVNR
ncbi:MAG: CPBP family intramembrane metalloprotease [Agarilytica sp.]